MINYLVQARAWCCVCCMCHTDILNTFSVCRAHPRGYRMESASWAPGARALRMPAWFDTQQSLIIIQCAPASSVERWTAMRTLPVFVLSLNDKTKSISMSGGRVRASMQYYLILLLSRLQFKWNSVINAARAAETSGTIICSATLLSKQSVISTYEKFLYWFDNVTVTQEQVEYLPNKLDAKQMFSDDGEVGAALVNTARFIVVFT